MTPARRAALVLLLGSAPVLTWAQTGSVTPPRPTPPSPSTTQVNCQVTGRVLLPEGFRSAERMLVRILKNGVPIDQVFTDSLGRFASTSVGPSVYEVEVAEEGFKAVRQHVDLSMFCRTELPPIMLERDPEGVSQPAEATVSADELRIPEKARKAFARGVRELHEKNRADRSVEHFREAIALYPEFDQAYMQLGLAFVQQREFAAAEENLEKCIGLNGKRARAFVLLGIVHGQQGHISDSLRALREAVRIDKTDWLGHFELGRALARLGLLEDAYKHAQRAHLLKPDSPGVHLLLHDISLRRRDYQTALAEAREFLALFPKDPQATQMRQQEKSLLQSGLVPQ